MANKYSMPSASTKDEFLKTFDQTYDFDHEVDRVYVSMHKKEGKLAPCNGNTFCSVNTSPFLNPYCMDSCPIREKCYAQRALMTYRRNANQRYIDNYRFLNTELIDRQLPIIPERICRLSAMGEITDMILKNYVRIAELNPMVTFGLFTHRSELIYGLIKPKNLIITLSVSDTIDMFTLNTFMRSPYVDYVYIATDHPDRFVHFDHHECIGRCAECMHCYSEGNQKMVLTEVK